jgi:hypothetical protein
LTDFMRMSSPELAKAFARLEEKVDLQGQTTAWLVARRMEYVIEKYKTVAKLHPKRRAEFMYMAEQLDRALENGFPEGVIREADKDPTGIIAQTLLYGREEAKRRVLVYRRARIQANVRYGVHPEQRRVLRVRPEARRLRAWKR